MSRMRAAVEHVKTLKKFMSPAQLNVMGNGCRNSEERDFFFSKLEEMANRVENMPKTYETENVKTNDKIVHLHYFVGGADWYIVEKDMVEDEPQYQAFGLANIGYGLSGLGYISINELTQDIGAELDLHFTPKTLAEIKAEHK